MSSGQGLSSIFDPESVAVVGATDDVSKLRGRLVPYLIRGGFEGNIYPVNPSKDRVAGLAAFPDLASLPGCVDLALIAAPGEHVPGILRQAASGLARSAIIFSAGVDMTQAADIIGTGKLRVLGPNTEGLFLPGKKLAATFAPAVEGLLGSGSAQRAAGRPISIVSQSGGLGFALFSRGLHQHLNVRSIVTTGNELDLECLEVVNWLLDEGESGVIVLLLEGLKDPARLKPVAIKAVERGVQLVVFKAGASDAGQRAVISHTAHLAGANAAYDCFFERYGIIRASDMEEALAAAAAFSTQPLPAGRRAAVVTTSGGAGIWAADLCAARNIEVPQLGKALQSRLALLIPEFGSTSNPVDTTAQAAEGTGASLYEIADILLADDEIDSVVINMGLSKPGRIEEAKERIAALKQAASKPVLFHSHILPLDSNLSDLASLGFHGFPSLRACAFALDSLSSYAEFLSRPHSFQDTAPRPSWLAGKRDGLLGAEDCDAFLKHYGIDVAASIVAHSAEQAAEGAARMGGKVALKIASPHIPHKTEAGGVELNLSGPAVAAAYHRIIANAQQFAPDAEIEGVQVQQMAMPGFELSLGILRDPSFGPLVLLATGGLYIEVFRDSVVSAPPITTDMALEMIRKLRSYPILAGARGRIGGDIDALAAMIVAVGAMAQHEAAHLEQLDLNPVFVYPKGEGVKAVDCLVVVRETPATGH